MSSFESAAAVRMLAINHAGFVGGAEINLRDLLTHLPSCDVDVLGIVAPGPGAACELWEASGLRTYPMDVPHITRALSPSRLIGELRTYLAFQRSMRALIAELRPEVIYANSVHAALAVTGIARATSTPLIWQIADLIKVKPLNKLMMRSLLGSDASIMGVAQATIDRLVELGGDRRKMTLNPCGVSVARFDEGRSGGPAVRSELGMCETDHVVGMFGQITAWKGWHVFVEAAALVSSKLDNARFICVGRPSTDEDQSYLQGLKSRANELGLGERMIWTGFRGDVPALMSMCDVVVHASVEPEPSGEVTKEAMAARVPVICSRCGGMGEFVRHEETGLLTTPGQSDELADAIIRLLSDPDLRSKVINNARRDVETLYTHERRAGEFARLAREVSGEKAVSRCA